MQEPTEVEPSDRASTPIGKVYLVGAGPGDPGMLTLRGKDCLQNADVVIYDYLANPRLLDWARQAEQICLGKHGSGRIYTQEEINAKTIELAQQGKQVVRLKGGDPAIFARTHEELQTICDHHIPYEIVPGITAALAVTSTVGIPLTHRDYSSAVALITGQGKAGGPSTHVDYQALASFPGTLVFYMGTTTVDQWSTELIRAGLDPSTPVVATRHCSLPTQSSFKCRLDEISDRVNQEPKLRPPVLFVVGTCAEEYGKYDWFESRPLFGRSILVTRPEHQASSIVDRFEALGAEVLVQPAIEIKPVDDQSELQQVTAAMERFDWVVFSSVNGVEYFMNYLLRNHDIRQIAHCRFAAIGPATARRLEDFYLKADLVPDQYEAESLANELVSRVQGKRVLLIRASRGREILYDEISKVAEVEQLVCYQSTDVQTVDPAIQARMEAGEIDYVTVTSSAIARSLHRQYQAALQKTKLVSISPVTTSALQELELIPQVEAAEYTMEGLISALLATVESTGSSN